MKLWSNVSHKKKCFVSIAFLPVFFVLDLHSFLDFVLREWMDEFDLSLLIFRLWFADLM